MKTSRALTVRTGERDAHSGLYGGGALNAAHVLATLIAGLEPGPDGRLHESLMAGVQPASPIEEAAWATVRDEVAAGRQAYVVCPLIDESEKLEVASAQETFDRLSNLELRGLRVGLLHGRLPATEKESVMDRFRTGELDVLVATTVIEVGVDVPNATVMVILDADRFGDWRRAVAIKREQHRACQPDRR